MVRMYLLPTLMQPWKNKFYSIGEKRHAFGCAFFFVLLAGFLGCRWVVLFVAVEVVQQWAVAFAGLVRSTLFDELFHEGYCEFKGLDVVATLLVMGGKGGGKGTAGSVAVVGGYLGMTPGVLGGGGIVCQP